MADIYVASSWRNAAQPTVVRLLRSLGHSVYDFRKPHGGTGFDWRQVDASYSGGPVTARQQREMTDHPVAREGYMSDLDALRDCDACVYVLPCGKSASWELGYAQALGKRCYVLWQGQHEPELMFREATVFWSLSRLKREFNSGRPLKGSAP